MQEWLHATEVGNTRFPLGNLRAGNHGSCIHHAHDIFEIWRVKMNTTTMIPFAQVSQRESGIVNLKHVSPTLSNEPTDK